VGAANVNAKTTVLINVRRYAVHTFFLARRAKLIATARVFVAEFHKFRE